MNGSGRVALGSNNFSGGLTLNSGTFLMTSDNALRSGTFTINGGVLDSDNGSRSYNNPGPQFWNGDFAFAAVQLAVLPA